MHASVLF